MDEKNEYYINDNTQKGFLNLELEYSKNYFEYTKKIDKIKLIKNNEKELEDENKSHIQKIKL